MKALLCEQYGTPESLVLREVESLKAGKGQVVIEVKACGVNFPDTLIIQGKYQFKPPLPFAPGSEVAGIVKEVGEGVTHYNVGDRVIAFTGWGGFATEALCDSTKLIPMPEGMDFTIASAFVLTYGTSHHALKDRGRLKAGETLLVLGAAGGVGIAAIEIGKALGAKVIAAASTDEKLTYCVQHGADATINYATDDLREKIKELTAGKGPDVIYDPVGGNFSEAALRSIGWRGRYLVVGFAAGDIPRIPLNLALLKGCDIVGVFWGSFTEREPKQNAADLRELLQWYLEGKLKPHISGTYSLEHAAEALNEMLNRKVVGKLVIVP
ncbi:MAG: NADPH:quinone oxidoreductase family protein [Chloroflexi bacterium]|uniref:NADPH:quinone oxidoreductase family protein n=1 Tax=Candidatus Chlorohelix allophototropha TaxID=3003348 RepID=A0A8T7M6T2_9CHLR|nr:NADPH:quinone oxidoreductase family protein [Chloroflexota bacterium]WJW69656.1 NADPH:quinone oxidoreductase family protein [Chloroflexota bacterium L227-S17]